MARVGDGRACEFLLHAHANLGALDAKRETAFGVAVDGAVDVLRSHEDVSERAIAAADEDSYGFIRVISLP